jgi:PmbA protein
VNALDVAGAALAHAAGDEAEVVVHCECSGLARFAASAIHQPTLIDDVLVQLTVLRDGRAGVATTNRIDGDGLAELARRAGEAAASASRDDELPPAAQPAEYPPVEGFDEETASLDPAEQASLAARAIAATDGIGAYGLFTSGAVEFAIAATTGVESVQRFTDATLLVIAAGDDASGYAERTSWRVSEIDAAEVALEAAEKAGRTCGAAELEPGRYAAVLEPYALSDLLRYFAYDAFNALALLEERSFLAGRLGEKVFDEKISIADDPLDPLGLPKAFDFEGTPKRRVELVEGGVARGVVWDRRTAAMAGTESTGHALPARDRGLGSVPLAICVAPGEAESLEELADLVGDGIYVTRLHYVNIVNPRDGVLTGMTRDGTFRVRGGKIAEPLVNLRFTIAVPELLADVPGLTRSRMLVNQSDFYDERYPTGALVPALATTAFNVTGTGSKPGI